MTAHRFLTEPFTRCEPSRPCEQQERCARLTSTPSSSACRLDGTVVRTAAGCLLFVDDRAGLALARARFVTPTHRMEAAP